MISAGRDLMSFSDCPIRLWLNLNNWNSNVRFTEQGDKDWFEKELIDRVNKFLGDEYVEMVEPNHHFVDFMRDAPEPTGNCGINATG